MIDERDVWARVGEVLDPELDRPLSALGFVECVEIRGAQVEVRLRLPTFWCAANFAFLMAADLRDRIGRAPGVERVTVRLMDHFAQDEIADAVNAGRPFSETFPGEADGELDELRLTFARKAFLVRQEQLMRALLRAGETPERLARLRAADLRADGDALLLRRAPEHAGEEHAGQQGAWRRLPSLARLLAMLVQKRAALGLPTVADDDPLFTTEAGVPLPPQRTAVMAFLGTARMVRLNGAFNTLLCTGLNRVQHGVEVDADALCAGGQEPESAGIPGERRAQA
ncbi:MAG TPA: iron-sulfur cluster assembly protein [Ktedonobacterales bacterium]|nr:iron-sulfur cluster assembly protein [Ktedonobacterales bacterium]